jgi:hypothetical protein
VISTSGNGTHACRNTLERALQSAPGCNAKAKLGDRSRSTGTSAASPGAVTDQRVVDVADQHAPDE